MDTSMICKEHGEQLQMICLTCKEPVCYKCSSKHLKQEHKFGMSLPEYAAEYIAPRYVKLLTELEKQKHTIDTANKDFVGSLPKVKEGLLSLKKSLEKLLEDVSKMIEQLNNHQREPQSVYSSLEDELERNLTYLQEAISKGDMKFIIGALNTPELLNVPGVGDSDKMSLEVVYNTGVQLSQSKEFDALHDGMMALMESCQKIAKPFIDFIPVDNKFVYGSCNPIGKFIKLCRFDIESKKLSQTNVSIPFLSVVSQIGRQIFISGGYNPPVNTVSEYIESTQCLISKAPMTQARWYYKTISTSASSFAAIGGNSTNGTITCCEEYSIRDNKWNPLPSLKVGRYGVALALLNKTDLYAIGGNNSNETIEILNLKERKEWVTITLISNSIHIYSYDTAFALSSDEIILLPCGSTNTGIFNTKTKTIKIHTMTLVSDQFYNNFVCDLEGNKYMIGSTYGHIFSYSAKGNKLDIIEHSKAYP